MEREGWHRALHALDTKVTVTEVTTDAASAILMILSVLSVTDTWMSILHHVAVAHIWLLGHVIMTS